MTAPFPKPATALDPDGELPFWRRKAMKDMTREEWESLCDGCGRCCLNKLQEDGSSTAAFYSSTSAAGCSTAPLLPLPPTPKPLGEGADCVTLFARNMEPHIS